jgi:TonB family protein
MLEQTTKREAGKNRVGAAFHRDRSRLYLALVLLLMALTVLLVKDRDFWFGGAETQAADETTPEWIPNRVVQPTAVPAAQPKPRVVAVKTSTKSAVAAPAPAVAITRNVLPPLEIEVVAGNTHGTFHLGNKPVNVELPPASGATVAQGPATVATERVQMSLDPAQDQEKVQARPKAIEASYPLLGRQMKVQGSVLLQALIGADGVIRDLRVLGGPAILATAAREAARQWQFKPYLQNGKPVETQATITVNFTIKVLDNGARDQMNTVVALSRGGE